MIIRPATLHDLDSILEIAMQQTERYPELKPNRVAMRKVGVHLISSARDYAMVGEDATGKVGAVLLAAVQDNTWAQRQHAAMLLWASRIPGGGSELLRAFRGWVLSRRAIKVAGMSPDIDLDWRILKLAERTGFKRHGGSYLLYN